MKKMLLTLTSLIMISLVPHRVYAQTYVLDKTIDLPGDGGYDYLSIDNVNDRLYVSHGTAVNVIDLKTEQPAGVIEDMKGVHGIAIINS